MATEYANLEVDGRSVRISSPGKVYFAELGLTKLDVVEYVHPRVFEEYRRIGEDLGFRAVFSGPFVRSSYMADVVAHEAANG